MRRNLFERCYYGASLAHAWGSFQVQIVNCTLPFINPRLSKEPVPTTGNLLLLWQLTYDSFRNKQSAAKVLGTPRKGDAGFEQRYKEDSMNHITELLQPSSLAKSLGYKVMTPAHRKRQHVI